VNINGSVDGPMVGRREGFVVKIRKYQFFLSRELLI
jgi:hypothetical protein